MRKTIFKIIGFLSLLAIGVSCSQIELKTHPEYKGVDPRTQAILDEYMWLSAQNDLTFYNKVTIGFKVIKAGNVIGLCTYGPTWREIDLDINYWNNSTKLSHLALLFHELSHCYCGRAHDYGEHLDYPESEAARRARAVKWQFEGGPRPGYWVDGCPVSLMYPVVVDNECMKTHYDEYIREMFDRCRPF